MEQLEQGQRVEFKIENLSGTGKVVGVATVEHPIIGHSYIIEPDKPINSETYNYSHFTAWSIQLTKIK